MFLNETKPPLDEAMKHFGVLGMHWGQRRADRNLGRAVRKQNSDFDIDEFGDEPNNNRKKKIATGLLIGAGTVATLAILHKSGHIKLPVNAISNLASDTQAEQNNARRLAGNARDAYKSKVGGRSFRPKNVGNPLFKVHPKETKDFVDAGFGKNGVFNVTNMTRGAKTVNDFNSNVWDVPMLALTSGRR